MVVLLSSSIALAQDFCKGDHDYDGDCDSDDVTSFLADFGRSQYNNPCPPDGPAPVVKTGQTSCYDDSGTEIDCTGTRQDGEFQRGVEWPEPRFVDHGDGTITDNLTGLMWLKDANCIATGHPGFDNDGTAFDGSVTWQHAFDFVNGINDGTYYNCQAGYTDWRLPDVKELFSLTDYNHTSPSLPSDHPFVNFSFVDKRYWTSTTYFSSPEYAIHVGFGSGAVDGTLKTSTNSVWPVRGGYVAEGCNEPSSLEARGGSCILYFTLSASYYCSDYTGPFFDFETGAAKCADRLDTSGGVLDPSYSTLSCSERTVEIEANFPGYMGLTGHCVIHCQEENEFIWNIYTSNPASACTGFDFFTPEELGQ